MRPNSKMAAAARKALEWYADNADLRGLVEPWQLRFARSIQADKTHATCRRVDEWFNSNDGLRATPGFFSGNPTAERLAWNLLGDDAGREWARNAVTNAPEEESIMSVIDRLEAEADDRERAIETFALDGLRPEWKGTLGLEGIATSDNRLIDVGGLTWRELPLALLDQLESAPGHDGAVAVGPITNIYREEQDGMAVIVGEGSFDSGEHGSGARERLSSGSKRGVSMDLTEVELDLPDDPGELEEILFGGGMLRIKSAKIGAATLVAIPAFADARLEIIGDVVDAGDESQVDALVASGGKLDGVTLKVVTPISFAEAAPEPVKWASVSFLPKGMYPADDGLTEIDDEPNELSGEPEGPQWNTEHLDALIASGSSAPAPPAEWFQKQRYMTATPKVIAEPDANGLIRIHGHVGVFGSCHIGRQDVCVDVPRGLDYGSFQGPKVESEVKLSDGSTIKAGPVVLDNVHPDLKKKASDAAAHYHWSGSLVAQVRCYEDNIGLQVQGWVLPGVTDDDLVKLRALSLSPDWRPRANADGGFGVVAILAVPVTGFNMGLVASGAEQEITEEDWVAGRNLAARKVAALASICVVPSEGLVLLAEATEAPELAARKRAALAALQGSCGCNESCCVS